MKITFSTIKTYYDHDLTFLPDPAVRYNPHPIKEKRNKQKNKINPCSGVRLRC